MFNDDGLLERGDVVRVAGRGATTLEHALGQLHLPPSAGSPDRTPRQPPPHVVGQRWYYNCWEGGREGGTTLEHALGQLPPHVVGQRWYYNCWEGGNQTEFKNQWAPTQVF
jgi:hypothetical protein